MKAGGPEKSSNKHGKASQVAPVVKNLPVNAGDASNESLIPGSGRSPGVGNGNSLQYFCQENSMDRGACKLQSMWSQRDTTGHTCNQNTERNS